MKKKILISTIAIIIILIAGALIWKQFDQTNKTTPTSLDMKIGAVLPLTGPLAFFGGPERDALNLAFEDVKSSGTLGQLKLDLVLEDSQSGAKGGVAAFTKLAMQDIKIIVTSLTTVCQATQPISKERQVLQIALSVHPSLAKQSPLTIRPYYGFEGEMERTANYIQQKGGKRIAVLYVDVPETSEAVKIDLVPRLKTFGAELVASESYSFGTLDIKSQLVKLAQAKPDFVIAMDFGNTYANILREAKALGISKKLICGIGMQTIPKIENQILEGIVVVAPAFVINPDQRYRDFATHYQAKYGRVPGYDECYTYDALGLIVKGIQNGGNNASNIAQAIKSLGNYSGVSGDLKISKDGNVSVDISIGVFKEGKIVPLP